MKKRLITLLIIVALVFGLGGFLVGIRTMNNIEDQLLSMFSEDVVEVRQGKLAGAFIAMADNESLSEGWEEVCTDVIRYIVEQRLGDPNNPLYYLQGGN